MNRKLTVNMPNYTSEFAPALVNVTTHAQHNIYAYSRVKLWTAYACAILSTAVFATVGVLFVMISRKSFSNTFSTIFRVAQGASYGGVTDHPERDDGADPLPSVLAAARIDFGFRKQSKDDYLLPPDRGDVTSIRSSPFP